MRSVMTNTFSQAPNVAVQRSSFDRTHSHKTTIDADYLYPIFVDEVLPGDTFNCDATFFGRLATPIHPLMDNMFLDTFWFYVPNRLVWDNWQKFMGEQINPGDSIDYLVPSLANFSSLLAGSLFDYFGLPLNTDTTNIISGINALPFRAYNLIYNEWFRDENLINSLTVPLGDGPDALASYALRKRAKRYDYFTSCLPWPQKFDAVDLPLGISANVLTASTEHTITGLPALTWRSTGGVQTGTAQTLALNASGQAGYSNTPPSSVNTLGSPTNLYADLSTATAATINQLRESFQIQRLLERDARSGTRYTEILKSHFGVTAPDFRLQRPEYLGGSSNPINFNSVPQTSVTAGTPQGNLAAFGTVGARASFTKSFVEHGYIIGLVNVRADLTYQRGLRKLWSRKTRYDFYFPVFANLGEQAVLNKEIWINGDANDDLVFGYQERWSEYRYFPSLLTGLFRSNHAQSLDVWHLSQDFATLPALNQSFIESNTPVDRVIAVPSEPHMILDSFIQLRCARPMPVHSVPGLIDHL